MKTYDNQCGSCEHLNINDRIGFKYRCTERRFYCSSEERACSRYRYCSTRDYYALWKRENSIWHIVTAIFEILKLSDSYDCVGQLHNFRYNILDKDPIYSDMLKEYDIVGPVLADKLRGDANNEQLCKNLIKFYLLPVLDLIKSQEYDDAVSKYLEMVNLLKSFYSYNGVEKPALIGIQL